MIGFVIDGRYAGSSLNKRPDSNMLLIETRDGERIAISKKNVVSIDDVTEQYSTNGRKTLMIIWNDFETSLIQFGTQFNACSISSETIDSVDTPNKQKCVMPPTKENKKKPHKRVKTKKRTSLLPQVLVILAIVVSLAVTAAFILNNGSVTLDGAGSFFVSEEQRIEEIKDEGLVQAKEYIRKALIEELDDPEDALTKLDSINVSYGLEVIEDTTYTITATYKYRLELSHVHADIYYICDVIGDLRTGETTTKLLDYYTSDPEIKVEPEKLFEKYCDSAWAEYKTSEYSDKIVIDTNPNDEKIQNSFTATFIESKKWYNQDADYAIQGINNALGLPPNLRDEIVLLEASDPSGYESFDGFIGYKHLYVTYNFHPNRGLEVTYDFQKDRSITTGINSDSTTPQVGQQDNISAESVLESTEGSETADSIASSPSQIPTYAVSEVISTWHLLNNKSFYVECWVSTFEFNTDYSYLYCVSSPEQVYRTTSADPYDAYNYDHQRCLEGNAMRANYRYAMDGFSYLAPPTLELGDHIRILCVGIDEPVYLDGKMIASPHLIASNVEIIESDATINN